MYSFLTKLPAILRVMYKVKRANMYSKAKAESESVYGKAKS